LRFEVCTGLLAVFGSANQLAIEAQLLVTVMIRAIESIHHERHPCRAAFQKCDTQFGKLVEHAVREHCRGLNHQAERMSQGMRRIVGRKAIQAEVMKAADVNGESATEFLRFFVKRPVDLTAQVTLNRFAI
jgi:hypothetical protein